MIHFIVSFAIVAVFAANAVLVSAHGEHRPLAGVSADITSLMPASLNYGSSSLRSRMKTEAAESRGWFITGYHRHVGCNNSPIKEMVGLATGVCLTSETKYSGIQSFFYTCDDGTDSDIGQLLCLHDFFSFQSIFSRGSMTALTAIPTR